MRKKKLEVIELNKEEEQIVLSEKQSTLILFLKKYGLLIFSFILILLLVAFFIFFKNVNFNSNPKIEKSSLITSLNEFNSTITGGSPITSEFAKNSFLNNGDFKSNGEVFLVEKIESSRYIIKFYSDGTALKIMGDKIIRISPLDDGSYGITESGIINTNAITRDISVVSTKEYDFGKVINYSDGSSEITDSKMDIFVRNGNDINESYIANHKLSYLKESKNIGNDVINYYTDGTILVIKNRTSYILRDKDDLEIKDNNIIFKNNNAYTITNTVTLDDGKRIDYYADGGAIIKEGSRTISVRQSNSISIKDNKIYEIVDSIYVNVCNTLNDGNIVYYTNGSAVINDNGKKYYVPENSEILFNDSKQIINNNFYKEELNKETNINGEFVQAFNNTSIIKTSDYIAIVAKDSVLYNSDGTIREITINKEYDNKNGFTITNSTNSKLNYRIVLEENEENTDLDTQYIRYQLSAGNIYIEPTRINKNIWKKDEIAKLFDIKGTNYILLESSIEAYDTKNVDLMLWTDYDTIPNSMQNRYFYGTIKIYAWAEE